MADCAQRGGPGGEGRGGVRPDTLMVNIAPRTSTGTIMNQRTLLPVFMPLASATTLARRFPYELRSVLEAHGADPRFVDHEIRSMGEGHYAKTASRSLLGVMNEFTFLGNVPSRGGWR